MAKANGVRPEILSFITLMPEALMRSVPANPVPFSTPRSWAALSRALDLVEQRSQLDREKRRALAFGRISAEDAAVFCAMAEEQIDHVPSPRDCLRDPLLVPTEPTARWFVVHLVRTSVARGELADVSEDQVNNFLRSLPQEFRFALLVDLVPEWGQLGADKAMFEVLKEVTGL